MYDRFCVGTKNLDNLFYLYTILIWHVLDISDLIKYGVIKNENIEPP